MLRLIHRKIGSILGLLAILMATLAPTVSHTLAADERSEAFPGALCSAQSPGSDELPSPEKATHWQACAYCGLLAHMPVLPSGTVAFAPTDWAIQPTAVPQFQSIRRVFPFTAAQPRAPPFSS
ncbi:DUF2946 domain-containing protein [Paraburkholderia sp. SIMBA_030]|uniref:DUF2946 domain-containing protein n=1 Tax=Paraburkholderia sp. SIMBA_030 TaxID=3085773 RepID=UPI00397E58A1